MKGPAENQSIRKLFTLLSACTDNPQPLSDIVAEKVAGTDAYQLWRKRGDYEFVSGTTMKVHAELEELKADDLPKLDISLLFQAHNSFNALKQSIDATERSITEETFDILDVVHKDWQGFLLKIARRLLISKLRDGYCNVIETIKVIEPLDTESITSIVGFIKAISAISVRSLNEHPNVTNFHIANCFKFFTEKVYTKLPERQEGYEHDEFDTPYQAISKIYPQAFFCINHNDYDKFVKQLKR